MTGLDEVEDEEKLAAELKGNTLRVYLYVLKSAGNVGVREVQRALGFSGPRLIAYHLENADELGLVENREKTRRLCFYGFVDGFLFAK